jgi:hypothetical protein
MFLPGESPGALPDIPRIVGSNRLRHPNSMKTVKTRALAFLCAQFNPTKTLRQLIVDRSLFGAAIHATLFVVMFL